MQNMHLEPAVMHEHMCASLTDTALQGDTRLDLLRACLVPILVHISAQRHLYL